MTDNSLTGFTTRQLVFLALTAAGLFVIDLFVNEWVDAIVGVSGAGFMITGFVWVAVLGFAGLTVKRFGAFTTTLTVYCVISIPTTVLGPPGAQKIIIGAFAGLIADTVVYALNHGKVGYYLGLGNASAPPLMFLAHTLLGLPVASLMEFFTLFIVLAFIQGLIGAWLAYELEERIRDSPLLETIREES